MANNWLTQRVFAGWDADVEVRSFDIGWMNPLAFDDVKVDYEGEQVVTIGKVQTGLTIPGLFTSSSDYGTITVEHVDALIRKEGQSSNIEQMIEIETDLKISIELKSADVRFEDDDRIEWAKVTDAQVAIHFREDDGVYAMVIDPTTLLSREPMKLALADYLPKAYQSFFSQKYVDAIVTMRMITYRKTLGDDPKLTSLTEVIVHELKFESPELQKSATAMARQYSGLPADSPDIAILHIVQDGKHREAKLVSEPYVEASKE